MSIKRNLILEKRTIKPILFDEFIGNSDKPLVIFSHGFKGFKDWGHFNYVADSFHNKGINFVKFNFSHNGTTIENPTDFADLEAFGNNNFSIELDDLKQVIDYCSSNIKFSELVLMGHSRGGGTSILKAAEDNRVAKIITWAAVSHLENRFTDAEKLKWKTDKVVYVDNARTNQQMPLYYQLYEDLMRNLERFNIQSAAEKLSIPHLIIHGTNDEVVGVNEAYQLNNWSKYSDLITLQDGNHTFGAAHPFDENKEELHIHALEVINDSISFVS